MVKSLKKILFEMIPVILGILIALVINNWKEDIGNKKFLNRVLSSIEDEMRENTSSIEEVMPKQIALIDTIDAYVEDSDVSILELIEKVNGFQAALIKNTSWKSFLNAKIELMDYETISVLTEIDEGKSLLKLKLEKLMDFAYENVESKERSKKEFLRILVLDVLDSEDGLLNAHKSFLKQRAEK